MADSHPTYMEQIIRLLKVPFGKGADSMDDHLTILAEAVNADACALLFAHYDERTARILGGTNLTTPADQWQSRFETILMEKHFTHDGDDQVCKSAAPFDGEPFLINESASSLLARSLPVGEASLITIALRRHQAAFTDDEVKRFSALAGVINLAGLYRYLPRVSGALTATDDLTGLGLFPDFHQNMVKELSRARRSGDSVAMGIMSVVSRDSDSVEKAILKITRTFKNQLRNFDTLDRYGPSELAFILPDLKSADGLGVVERVLGEITTSLGGEKALNIYVGLSCYPEDGSTVERLIEMAEAAVNRAMEAGKPGVYRWTVNSEQ
jgi:diguanylate cyclase (GGDEF)-like protein